MIRKISLKPFHYNYYPMRVKLAASKDVSLVRLPLCEAALEQHVLRTSFQTKNLDRITHC